MYAWPGFINSKCVACHNEAEICRSGQLPPVVHTPHKQGPFSVGMIRFPMPYTRVSSRDELHLRIPLFHPGEGAKTSTWTSIVLSNTNFSNIHCKCQYTNSYWCYGSTTPSSPFASISNLKLLQWLLWLQWIIFESLLITLKNWLLSHLGINSDLKMSYGGGSHGLSAALQVIY